MVDLDALDDLTEFTNYWIDLHAGASERETLRQTLHEIHAHFHVAPAEPVTLTDLQEIAIALQIARNTKFRSDDSCELQDRLAVREVLAWLTERGFALVRTGGAE